MGRIIAGKYCLLHELGRGGMASVWAAEHISLRSQVAIKLIEPQVLGNPHVQERFEREARALATLRSANVVQILDYGIDAGIQYLVMELLQGRTLRAELTARGRLRPDEVSTVVQHVSRAMTVSHAAGFVHRDLKPENIFLTGDDEDHFNVKVLDFGITKALAAEAQPLTSIGGLLGTCEYMSPEQALGETVDIRSDLWSLAVVAFESLVGFTPFRANSAAATLSAICHGPILVPSEAARVPPGFDAWFARATQRDPKHRFQSARQLSAELRPVLDLPRDWLGADTPAALEEADERTLRVHPAAGSPFERRGSARVSSSIPAAIGGQRDLRNTALIYNTSRSGALLATRRSWAGQETITLTLHLDSAYEGDTVLAQIVRVAERDSPFWKFDVAIRFVEPLSEELLARIEAKARTRG
ncbi:MAG TPA: serine/threonine-protein kinase [Polyangiaceae bacterium]